MDWTKINLNIFSDGLNDSHGIFSLPDRNEIVKLNAVYADNHWHLNQAAINEEIEFNLRVFDNKQV